MRHSQPAIAFKFKTWSRIQVKFIRDTNVCMLKKPQQKLEVKTTWEIRETDNKISNHQSLSAASWSK